jgi:ElaB/YqjD/DUF883 family membrane-anchored ribosome-binding protein
MAEEWKEKDRAERNAEAIRQEIASKQVSISQTMGKLGDKLHDTVDWRQYVSRYPYASLGVAAGVGFIVAAVVSARKRPVDRIREAIADAVEEITDRAHHSVRDLMRPPAHSRFITAPLLGLVSKGLVQLVEKSMDGRARPTTWPSDRDQTYNPSNIH